MNLMEKTVQACAHEPFPLLTVPQHPISPLHPSHAATTSERCDISVGCHSIPVTDASPRSPATRSPQEVPHQLSAGALWRQTPRTRSRSMVSTRANHGALAWMPFLPTQHLALQTALSGERREASNGGFIKLPVGCIPWVEGHRPIKEHHVLICLRPSQACFFCCSRIVGGFMCGPFCFIYMSF